MPHPFLINYRRYPSLPFPPHLPKMNQDSFRKIPTSGGGDCFFRALSIVLYNTQHNHRELRTRIVDYILEHRDDSLFAHIAFSTDGECSESIDAYCKRMSKSQCGIRSGEYADEFIIAAASEYLKQPIHIISSEYTYRGVYGSQYTTLTVYIHYGHHHFTALSTSRTSLHPQPTDPTPTTERTVKTTGGENTNKNNPVASVPHCRRSTRMRKQIIRYTPY